MSTSAVDRTLGMNPPNAAGPTRPNAPASPYGLTMRLAWLGRVSTEDQQDPTLSLPRQLHNSRVALPAGFTIVAHFYDIESGRKDLDARGSSLAHEQFDIAIARDGGIQDLLAESRRPDRRFDGVICESIERVARRTYYGTKIEHDLEAVGVALFAADEPISVTGKRATTILTRRVKQGVAEWYVLETLEKAWDGFCEHTRQGWNIGRPPYGYTGQQIPHPVPARRAEGKTKTRLAPDPTTGPVVTTIFGWRVTEQLGYQAIVDRLNADLTRYPAPVSPDPARTRTDWTRSSVQALLTNPKYTGYMVWNRRATKKGGRCNPPSDWVWSPQPTHEPLVTRELFDAAQRIATGRRGSRTANAPNRHPATKRSYLLRSYVICAMCGRRMFGKTLRGKTYYACQPGLNLGQAARDRHPDHPGSIWVREDGLIDGLQRFLNERVFGRDRRDLIAADLDTETAHNRRDNAKRRAALERAINEVGERQRRLIDTLETQDDPTGVIFGRVRQRVADLEATRTEKIAELADLDQNTTAVPDPDLLEQLPEIELDWAAIPADVQRDLFNALQLEIRYDRTTNTARGQITLVDDTIARIPVAATTRPNVCGTVNRTIAVRAPGRIRTCGTRFRKPMLYPLSYEGARPGYGWLP